MVVTRHLADVRGLADRPRLNFLTYGVSIPIDTFSWPLVARRANTTATVTQTPSDRFSDDSFELAKILTRRRESVHGGSDMGPKMSVLER